MSENKGKLPINSQERKRLLLDNQLCFQVYSASRAMTQAYRPLLKKLGLTYPQYLVMLLLWEKQGQIDTGPLDATCCLAPSSVSQLGQRLRLDSGTLSPLLKRLEQQGLLRRQRSQEDERQLEVVLTPQGIALSKQAAQVPQQMICDLEMPVETLQTLKHQLEQLQNKISS